MKNAWETKKQDMIYRNNYSHKSIFFFRDTNYSHNDINHYGHY